MPGSAHVAMCISRPSRQVIQSITFSTTNPCDHSQSRPKASVVSVGNVAAASLELALPTSQTASTMLAPEEVSAPSSRAPRSRSEMTPAEKRAESNKRKKQRRTREQLNKGVDAHSRVEGVKRQKEDALKSLVKSGKGVTVIGKKDKGLISRWMSEGVVAVLIFRCGYASTAGLCPFIAVSCDERAGGVNPTWR